MSWVTLVIIGATLNAFNNLGYKVLSNTADVFLLTSLIFAIAAVVMGTFTAYTTRLSPLAALKGRPALLLFPMGTATALVMVLIISAFQSGGPISLVDPLMACAYSLASVLIGIKMLKEKPNAKALLGIALFLAGAFLMSQG